MKKTYKALNQICLFALVILTIAACEEDFTTLESDIDIGDNFSTDVDVFAVKAFTKRLERVQTNNIPVGMLGLFKDALYGNSSSNFLSQMSPTDLNPTFGEQVELDSVILTIPYFSTITEVDELGNNTFLLDSIIPVQTSIEDLEDLNPLELYIYRNNYFLRDFDISDDSDFDESLIYFSDGMTSEGTQINEVSDIQGELLYQDLNFKPSAEQIELSDQDGVKTTLSPSLRIRLDQEFGEPDIDNNNNTTTFVNKEYWENLILNREGAVELSNLSNFLDYFRGLYFKTQSINNDGFFMFFNYSSSANLTLHYSTTTIDTETGEDEISQNTYVLNFSGNNINFLDNSDNSLLNDGDPSQGDETLYLKGGQGAMAVIDLFDENIEGSSFCEFMQTYKRNYNCDEDLLNEESVPSRFINDAFLKVYVNQDILQGNEPERLYLYDMKNNSPIIDYFIDPTSTREFHLEPLELDDDGLGISYKFRITEHLNNIITRDSTNLRLGLVVSNNITLENTAVQLNAKTSDSDINRIPVSSITQNKGTVLYGSHPNVPEDIRIQLEIFYTEPEN